jgi:hypothetical protein
VEGAFGERGAEGGEEGVEAGASDRRNGDGRGRERSGEVGARSAFVYTVTIGALGGRSSFAT